MDRRGSVVAIVALLITASCDLSPGPPPPAQPIDPAQHVAEVTAWHEWRLGDLQQPASWLSLVGLFWLDPGEHRFGAAADDELQFPMAGTDPLGRFEVGDSVVTMIAQPGAGIRHEGETVTTLIMAGPDLEQQPVVQRGSLEWLVIRRNDRYAVRIRDTLSATRTGFTGIARFPVDERYRLGARFEAYDPPKPIKIPNYLGYVSDYPSPGAVVFEFQGEVFRLDITDQSDTAYFVPFADPTNGHDTYGGGRFVWFPAPTGDDGATVIDFNKSYNPPCVFSAYATCPMPPRQNELPFHIPAGEKTFEMPAKTGTS